jgi:hypothetical protein
MRDPANDPAILNPLDAAYIGRHSRKATSRNR